MLPPDAELLSAPPAGRFRAALFDFDGTISLLREGWARIMAEMGLGYLRDQNLPTGPEAIELDRLEAAVLGLSGKPSVFQMRRLADEVAARGGTPGDPDDYLAEFLRRLLAVSGERSAAVADGRAAPDAWTVPGTRPLLDALRRKGIPLYLASGTDLAFVRTEADLLGLLGYFGRHVYAPTDNTPDFSKRAVVEMILRDLDMPGGELVGFGDGASETAEVKRVGGFMVGVASQEAGVPGANRLKRDLLAGLGADVIVPDYRSHRELVEWVFEGGRG